VLLASGWWFLAAAEGVLLSGFYLSSDICLLIPDL